MSIAAEDALRVAASAFHKIVADHGARKLLDREEHKLSQPLYDSLVGKLLDPSEVEKIAADGFELCVRALGAMGAKDVSIHECGEKDMEAW